ncbi:MAG: hypothetical protein GF317_18150 [Candidatus Lokiarchaeota archaeon]|nr:hypothetical protein [Candidatus Lokiarchaeota archaeon]MBD3201436.1 hypothetical protein [Candidatus Lokiarchaeota archaeon]
MILNWLIADNIDEVGLSWFDFYSIGHICMGIGIFLLFSFLYTIPMTKTEDRSQVHLPLWGIWLLTLLMGIIWEIVENVLFFELGIKFEGRKDSLQNVFTDILLVGVGGLLTWLFAHLVFKYHVKTWPYYVFGLIGLGLWIGLFLILRYTTLF